MSEEAEQLSIRLAAIQQLHPDLLIIDPCGVCQKQILGSVRTKHNGEWCHRTCVEDDVELS